MFGHSPSQTGALLQYSKGGPEGDVEAVGLLGHEAVGGVAVTDMAAEFENFAVAQFPERPAALRAGEPGGGAVQFAGDQCFAAQFRHVLLGFAALQHLLTSLGDGLPCQPLEYGRHLFNPKNVIDGNVLNGAFRHTGQGRFLRILHDHGAAELFDEAGADGPVIQSAGKDQGDDPRAMASGGGAKQRIDRRPEPVFFGAAGGAQVMALEQQVTVAWGNVDASVADRPPIHGVLGGKSSFSAEQLRQHAAAVRRRMDDDEQRRRQIGGKTTDQFQQGLNSPRRGPDDDDVVSCHQWNRKHGHYRHRDPVAGTAVLGWFSICDLQFAIEDNRCRANRKSQIANRKSALTPTLSQKEKENPLLAGRAYTLDESAMSKSLAIHWKQLHGDHFAGSRVMITGGAGFIGSHLAETLVELGAQVLVLDDLSGGSRDNLRSFAPVEFVHGSILNYDLVAQCTNGCRYVFHQAALGSVPRSVEEPRLYADVNIIGTLNVLEAARKANVQRLMFAASSSAYGENPVPWVETLPPMPKSPYAATKLAGEGLVRAWAASYGLDSACLRYFNIFGPRQNANSAYAAVIAAFAKALLSRERPVIYGDGTQSRDFTYVANVVHANLLAARHEQPLRGEVINVGCGGQISINDLAAAMADAMGRPDHKPLYEAERPGDIKHSFADLTRAKEVLGYGPIVNFEAGLEQTFNWYKSAQE